jgi:hypothetical protein
MKLTRTHIAIIIIALLILLMILGRYIAFPQ